MQLLLCNDLCVGEIALLLIIRHDEVVSSDIEHLSVARKKVEKKLATNGLSEPHFSSLVTNF